EQDVEPVASHESKPPSKAGPLYWTVQSSGRLGLGPSRRGPSKSGQKTLEKPVSISPRLVRRGVRSSESNGTTTKRGDTTMTSISLHQSASVRSGTRLWIAQGVLAALFLFAGVMKLVMPADVLAAQSH